MRTSSSLGTSQVQNKTCDIKIPIYSRISFAANSPDPLLSLLLLIETSSQWWGELSDLHERGNRPATAASGVSSSEFFLLFPHSVKVGSLVPAGVRSTIPSTFRPSQLSLRASVQAFCCTSSCSWWGFSLVGAMGFWRVSWADFIFSSLGAGCRMPVTVGVCMLCHSVSSLEPRARPIRYRQLLGNNLTMETMTRYSQQDGIPSQVDRR